MTHVDYIAKKLEDGTRWTVEQMLDSMLADVRAGRKAPTKSIVLFLNDLDGRYEVSFAQSGLTMSQGIALLEIAKTMFKQEIGY